MKAFLIEHLLKLIGYAAIAAIIGGIWLSYIEEKHKENAELTHLWNTMIEVREIGDPAGQDPVDDKVTSLNRISAVEKNKHQDVWKKYVPGTENDYSRFLNQVATVVKVNHRPVYDLIAMNENSKDILTKNPPVASWSASDLSPELSGLIFSQTAKAGKSDVSRLALSMIKGWQLVEKTPQHGSGVPVLSLEDNDIQEKISEISQKSGSLGTLQLLAHHKGYLVPTFADSKVFQSCFKVSYGLVDANNKDKNCKNFLNQYIASFAVSPARMGSESQCSEPLVQVEGITMDFDPCLKKDALVADLQCQRSLESFIRVKESDPSYQNSVRIDYLRHNCKDEINHLENQKYRAYFSE